MKRKYQLKVNVFHALVDNRDEQKLKLMKRHQTSRSAQKYPAHNASVSAGNRFSREGSDDLNSIQIYEPRTSQKRRHQPDSFELQPFDNMQGNYDEQGHV